jgi:hypothetical protein
VDSQLINIGGHGLGDCILSLQISHLLKQKQIKHTTLISTRDQIYKPLYHIFSNELDLNQIDQKYANDNALLHNQDYIKEIASIHNSDNITYNVPDLLFRNPLAFKYNDYGLNPQLIKKTRILSHLFNTKENIIYCGLLTTTKGYTYHNIPLLLRSLAEHLPNYIIYFPKIKTWDKDLDYTGNFNAEFPSNVWIDDNPQFEKSLDVLTKSKYGIFTCNGPSHIAYQIGIPRLILDPQFNKIPWMARWKEDYEECIDINTECNDITALVVNNINNPETLLVDRKILLNLLKNGYNSWKDIFYLKY